MWKSIVLVLQIWTALSPITAESITDTPYRASAALFGPSDKFICNAVVIAKDRLVTSADCLTYNVNGKDQRGRPEDFHVAVAHTDIERFQHPTSSSLNTKLREISKKYYVKIVNITVHPNNVIGSVANDIAVLGTSEDSPARTIVIAERINLGPLTYPQTVQVHGWGIVNKANRFSSEASSYTIRTVTMQLLDPQNCVTQYGDSVLPDQHLCLRPKHDEGVCDGFAEAPIVLGGQLIGIVSFVEVNCSLSWPTVGVRLGYFADFLGSTVPKKSGFKFPDAGF